MIALSLRIVLIIGVLLFLSMVIYFLVHKRLNLKYTLIWLLSALVMLVIAVFPQIVGWFSHLIGISTPVNTVFLFALLLLMLIILSLTMIVSHMNDKIYRLAQTQALLEERIRHLE